MQPEILALLAASCWAVASILSAHASSQMGAFSFTRWRLFFAMAMLWTVSVWTGQWRTLEVQAAGLLVLSSLIGIFIGDTALFACMNRLGPRRAGALFATHAVFSVVMTWIFLGKTLWGASLWGSALLVSGVMIAVLWGRRADEGHAWEQTHGPLIVGVGLGLVAAASQALATLMLKPLMSTGLDAITASAVRTSAGFAAHAILWATGCRAAKMSQALSFSVLWHTFCSAAIAMAVGMTLILFALHRGQANLVGVFSSVTPVMLLPLLWVVYRRRPASCAWLGAGLAVLGTALILLA